MKLDVKKWAPWNWFKKEEEEQGYPVSVHRQDTPAISSMYSQNALMDLHREMDRIVTQAFQNFAMPSFQNLLSSPSLTSSLLKPSVDISERDKDYVISVEVPGVDQDQVRLELANGALTIRGEKIQQSEDKKGKYQCIERSYGSFKRVLSLPSDADEEKIDARFKNGVLEITVGRKSPAIPDAKTRLIDIKSD